MSTLFFDYLIHDQEVIAFLDTHDIDPEEREELVSLIDEIYHHRILNLILSHLAKDLHDEFASLLQQNPSHPDILIYLKAKIPIDIEGEITKHSEKVKNELIGEITKHRRKH